MMMAILSEHRYETPSLPHSSYAFRPTGSSLDETHIIYTNYSRSHMCTHLAHTITLDFIRSVNLSVTFKAFSILHTTDDGIRHVVGWTSVEGKRSTIRTR